MALALLKPLVAERDVEAFDFVADLIVVLNGERLVEAGVVICFEFIIFALSITARYC